MKSLSVTSGFPKRGLTKGADHYSQALSSDEDVGILSNLTCCFTLFITIPKKLLKSYFLLPC